MFGRPWFGSYGCKWKVGWKEKEVFHATDDNSLAISSCFSEISIRKSARIFGWRLQSWSSENTVPQKLFHTKRGSLSSSPLTEEATPPSTDWPLLLRQMHFSDT